MDFLFGSIMAQRAVLFARVAFGICLIALLVIFALMSGCSTAQVQKLATPQQLLNDFCPVVNADLKMLAASPLLTQTQQTLVGQIAVDNAAVCAAGGSINVADIQKLNQTALPALIGLVAAIPGLPDAPAITLGLMLASPILTQILQTLPATATPASAPVPASS